MKVGSQIDSREEKSVYLIYNLLPGFRDIGLGKEVRVLCLIMVARLYEMMNL